jgi:penicillin-binding protein 1C
MNELAALYAMLARGGNLTTPLILNSAVLPTSEQQTKLLSPEASKLTLEMLRENPRPLSGFDSNQTSHSLAVPWKTGTSFGFRDAWAAGIVGPYTLVVWLGNFDGRGNPAFIGRDAAGPLFFSLVDALGSDANLIEPNPKQALNIKKVKVCAVSGELPGPFCKHLKDSWFIPVQFIAAQFIVRLTLIRQTV